MKKLLKKSLSLMLVFLMVFSVFSSMTKVLAEEMPENERELTKDNYWAELSWYKDSTHKGVIPTYLKDYFETSRVNWANRLNEHSLVPFFPNAGISSDEDVDKSSLEMVTQYLSVYSKDLPHKEHPNPELNRWIGGKQWNPYNFDYEKDLLTENITDYNIRADIKERGLSSTTISNHRIGDKINLDFHVDLSLFRKFKNTALIAIINSEFPEYYMMKNNMPETAITQSDAELVFVLDLPKGLESLDTTKYKLSGIDGFDDLLVTKEKNGRRIVVKARLKAPNTFETLKELYKKIQKVKSATLSVDGLQVTSDVEVNKNNTVIGYAYGVHENIFTTDNNVIFNKDDSAIQNDNTHYFFRQSILYAAKQSVDGKDEAGDVNKPNLITYTFRVNHNKVTFMNESETYATIDVENGKAIDTDNLTDQSMPANPSKAGYTFKEWNTSADGKGMKFTGTTVVNEDTTVYAIYDKNISPMNEAPTLEVKDKTIKKGEKLDLMSLVISAKDKEDGDLTKDVKLVDDGGFNKDKIGKYTVMFKVTDKDGASVTKKAVVTVVDESKPALKPDNNSGKKLPKTGNDSNIILYATLLGLSGAIIIAVGIRRKKEN